VPPLDPPELPPLLPPEPSPLDTPLLPPEPSPLEPPLLPPELSPPEPPLLPPELRAHNVRPSLSDDPRDKLAAALNWHYAKMRDSPTYQCAPMYFDACREWYDRLSADDQETTRTLADVIGSAHKDFAESIAGHLPSAPRCPL
jgi:hypothetical protein